MRNLLSANFLRLRKAHLFWGILAVGVFFAVFRIYTLWSDWNDYGITSLLDEALFNYAQIIGLTAAVFVSLFLGTEYSDGAIRNKIASGCSRITIYLAAFLTVFAASVLSLAAYWVVVLVTGVPLFGLLKIGAGEALFYVLGILLMTAVLCAVFTLVTMNCSNKAASAVLCILLFFTMLVASTYIYSRLEAPEFISGYELSVNGQIVPSEPEPNPRYLQPGPRKVYEWIRDLLPTGQSIQYSILEVACPVRLLLCSLGLTAVFTAAGAALFRRKDLK